MKLSEYADFDAVGLAAALERGDYSRAEAVEAAIEAIEKLNPQLNAVVMKNFDVVRKASTAKTAGPLSGVPFLLKDVNVFSEDMPTTFSSRFFEGAKPQRDSEIVRRWRNAGLLVMGKTNASEFAGCFLTEPAFRGMTVNPWNASLTVGGSSGGAGSAVASGIVPIAHGTDLGGSIRIPAACNGVYGLKPTSGLSPVEPSVPEIAHGYNCDHVLTRSVRDSAAALDVTAGYAPGYRYRVERKVDSYLGSLSQPLPKLRIGVCLNTPSGEPVPERQCKAVQRVCEIFESTGHDLSEYAYPTEIDIGEWADTLWMVDVVYEIDKRIAEIGREPREDELTALGHYIRERIPTESAMDLHRARIYAHQNSVILMRSMQHLDLVLTPTLGCDPIPVGSMDSVTDAFDYETWGSDGYAFAPFAAICNTAGQPAASLPVQLSEGEMPAAVQLAGHHCFDHVVLQASAQVEEALGWRNYRPPVWAGS